MFKRRHYRVISCIAICAVLFAALAPTLAQAFPARSLPQTLWQQLCTSQGSKLLAADPQNNAAPKSAPGSMNMHFEHCPYCFSHAGAVGLIHDSIPAIMRLDLSYALPQLFYRSPYPLFAWVKSSPRAPPYLS